MADANRGFERPLPGNPDAERMCLGTILLDDKNFDAIAAIISAEDFSMEKHRRIWKRMQDLRERGENIDRVTLANELMRQGQIESVDGFSYVVSLDEHIPRLAHPESYARIVQHTSALRKLIFAGQKLIDGAFIAESSPEELIANHAESIQGIQETRAPKDDGGRTPEEIVTSAPGGVSGFLDPSQRIQGLQTGFTKFDDLTRGLHEGDLIIIAGRPSMGKSAVSLNIAQHLATHPKQRKSVAVFSLEMSGQSLMTRLMCSGARVDSHKFQAGYLNEDERYRLQVALDEIISSRLRIYDRAEMPLSAMCSAIRKLVKEEGLHLAVIDYLQLIGSHRKRTSDNRTQELSEVTRTLKLLAMELEIPLIVLSQLSRACETRSGDHRPILSDLRDSGSIEQDADVVAFVYREEIYRRDRADCRGTAELIVAKNRNGPVATVKLRFLGKFVRFENSSDELPEGETAPVTEAPKRRRRKGQISAD